MIVVGIENDEIALFTYFDTSNTTILIITKTSRCVRLM